MTELNVMAECDPSTVTLNNPAISHNECLLRGDVKETMPYIYPGLLA